MRSVFESYAVASFCVLSALPAWVSPAHAQACSCVEQGPADAVHDASAVFEGRVVSVSQDAAQPGALLVTLDAVRAWKGVEVEQVRVQTAQDGAGCGYPFVKDQSYLVYARSDARDPKQLDASLCSRTRPIAEADADIAAIGMGVVPFTPRAPNIAHPDNVTLRPAAGGCGGCSVGASSPTSSAAWPSALLVAISLIALRRKRR